MIAGLDSVIGEAQREQTYADFAIYEEIKKVGNGEYDKVNNPLKNAPHTQQVVCADDWNYPYTRKEAAFPLEYVAKNKFWASVARINNTYGDRNLVCSCEPVESYL